MVELGWPDLFVAAVAFGPVLVAVPFLRFLYKMPVRCAFQGVEAEGLEPSQARWFGKIDAQMAKLGFQPVATFRVSNLQGRNLSRAYMSASDPAVALATAISDGEGDSLQSASYVEFHTDFRDGTSIGTRGVRVPKLLDDPPTVTYFDHPHTKDPAALKARHDAHCEPHRIREAVFYRPDDFFERFDEAWRKQIDLQLERRLLTPRSDGALRPTLRLSLRGALEFLSPCGTPFSPGLFGATLLFGFCVPALALLGLSRPEVRVVTDLSDVLGIGLGNALPLAAAPVFALTGAALGWMVDKNGALWAFVLSYTAGRLLHPAGIGGEAPSLFLFAASGSMVLALLTSRWRNRRRDLA